MNEPLTLATLFLSRRAASCPWPASTELESALQEMWDTGRRTWPDLELSPESLTEHLAGLINAEDANQDPISLLNNLAAADLYLAAACIHGSPGAIEAFERLCISRVPALVGHMNQTPAFTDDLQQELREITLVGGAHTPPRLMQYRGRGTLPGWFSSVAIRTALNRLRGQRPSTPLEDEALPAPDLSAEDPETATLRSRFGDAFNQALRDAFASLSPQQRHVMHLYHVGGLGVEQIGVMFQVHHSTIVRWLAAARAAILRETRRLLRERMHISSAEFSSVVRLVYDQLDISLSRLNGDANPK